MYADAQLAAPLVEQVHGERVELDEPADQPGNLPQQLVEIEDRRDLPSEVEERGDELLFAGRGWPGAAAWEPSGV